MKIRHSFAALAAIAVAAAGCASDSTTAVVPQPTRAELIEAGYRPITLTPVSSDPTADPDKQSAQVLWLRPVGRDEPLTPP